MNGYHDIEVDNMQTLSLRITTTPFIYMLHMHMKSAKFFLKGKEYEVCVTTPVVLQHQYKMSTLLAWGYTSVLLS